MYHFFVDPENIKEKEVCVLGTDVNHIRNVLRMKEGENVLISDGMGSDYLCSISSFVEEKIILDIIEKTSAGSEPSVKFYLFQGLPKADKFETIIQKAVELGAYEIVPMICERSIVKYDEKKQKAKHLRWNKIAESAAKQSHRGIIPQVKEVMDFEEAIAYAKASFYSDASLDKDEIIEAILLIPYENYKDIKATKEIIGRIRPGMRVAIFIGPEGGFTDDEIRFASDNGLEQISLGNRILRTETAGMMLLSVLMFQTET